MIWYAVFTLFHYNSPRLLCRRRADVHPVPRSCGGNLLILAGIYLLCREFISGFAESPVGSWVARGVLVIFLIYLLLSWNNLKAERSEEPAEPPEKSDDTD